MCRGSWNGKVRFYPYPALLSVSNEKSLTAEDIHSLNEPPHAYYSYTEDPTLIIRTDGFKCGNDADDIQHQTV